MSGWTIFNSIIYWGSRLFDPGYTYRATEDNRRLDDHLCIVLSRPFKGKSGLMDVLVVKCSSWEAEKDQSCIIEKDEHPFAIRRSLIFYRDTFCAPIKGLELGRKNLDLEAFDPFDGGLLKRVLEGAILSDFMDPDYQRILESQNLVDPAFLKLHPIAD